MGDEPFMAVKMVTIVHLLGRQPFSLALDQSFSGPMPCLGGTFEPQAFSPHRQWQNISLI